MGFSFNPANWMITDTLQGQEGGFTNPLAGTSSQISQLGGLGGSNVGSVSNLSAPDQTPQVLGTSINGSMYYDPATGQIGGTNMDGSPLTKPPGSTGPTVEQQQAAAQQAAWATARGNRATGLTNIYGSANDAATNLQGRFANSVQDNLRVLQQGQTGIDLKSQNNEASRTQGMQGILGMVGRGIQSGGKYLANRNAGSSSAAGEIARAYGDIGRRQASSVGNQYAQNAQEIAIDQDNQNYNVGKTQRDFSQGLQDSVNGIVESARTQLAQLDLDGQNASLPDRIAIEQEKQNIKNQVLAKLQQYDAQLQQGAQGIKARDRQGNIAAATQQLEAGQAPADSFQYTDQAPAQFQNTGPFSSGLPIFINPNKRQLA